MDYYDFLVHLRLCILSDGKEKEFELAAHGKGPSNKLSAKDIMRKKVAQELGSKNPDTEYIF